MINLHTTNNPLKLILRNNTTNTYYTLAFNDATGELRFETEESLLCLTTVSAFNNRKELMSLEDCKFSDDTQELTIEYLVFVEKLINLFLSGGEDAITTIFQYLYLQQGILCVDTIEAFCEVHGYDTELTTEAIMGNLRNTFTVNPKLGGLITPVHTVYFPTGHILYLSPNMFTILKNGEYKSTQIFCTDINAEESLNFYQTLSHWAVTNQNPNYFLAKSIFSHILLTGVAETFHNLALQDSINEKSNKIILSQLLDLRKYILNRDMTL